MPRPSASAVANRFAAYWIAEALTGDESFDISSISALVGVWPDSLNGAPDAVRERVALRCLQESVWPDSLNGAPEAVRERVALRCLQELVSVASAGEAPPPPEEAAPAAAAGMLKVDASRSCEDFLRQLVGEVGRSGSLEKGMLLPFSQDIQKFICIKGPTLPKTSFDLLGEVYPMEQNGNDQHDNIIHDPGNTEKPGFATDGAQPQQADLANLVDERNTENLQKDAMASTPDFHQPCTSDNRCFDQPQEDAIDAVGVNARSPEDSPTNVDKHVSVAVEPSLASCADLLGSNVGTMSEQDTIDHTTMVQSQSCGVKNPNTPHYNNGDGPPVDVTCIQSSKDSILEGLTMLATVSPVFDSSNDALPASTSETSHLPEFITAEDTSMTSELHIRKTHPNSPQHDNGDKADQNVDYGSAGIQSTGKDPDHDECTLQAAAALPSEACNGATQGDKSEIEDLPENATEHTKTFEQENSDKAHLEADCSDKANQALYDALPASTSETSHLPEFITAEDTSMTSELHIRKTHPNSPQHDHGDKANQNVDYGSASIQSTGKDPDHDECTLQAAAALPSEACNGATQGDKSEIEDLPENATEHTKMFEQENSDKAHLEADCSDKANQALYDGSIMKKNVVCGKLNVQTALESRGCSMALHNKISEPNHSSEQNIGKNTTGVQKDCCSIPTSLQDVSETRTRQASNKKTMGNTEAETSHVHSSDDSFIALAAAGLMSMATKIPFYTQDQDANGPPLEGLPEQDLCIKCGKDGQLMKCSCCLLAAHDSCFGSSVTFDDSGQFYCPICLFTKATEAYQKAMKMYSEARKNLSTFIGRKQLVKQHKQQTAVSQRAEENLNGCNASKRQGNHQSEVNNLSHRDEEPVRQRKQQKTNATSDVCPQEVVTEKAPAVQNADVAPTNKHCVLQNKRKRAQVADHERLKENVEARGESGNDDSSHKARRSSQNKCSPAANQNVDADKEDVLTGSHQSEDSDEIEAISYDSSKQSSPPWHNLRNHKSRYQDKDTAIPSNSKKARGHHDEHMASPSMKRNYACPPKRYSNPVVSTGRRTKLCWTEQEEAALREAMAKFTPRDNGSIPWVHVLEYGRGVFHRTRLPADLRVKWRNMKKKSGS
ncbi:hypothetical protein ABZP36_031599 [Zizania latifolia]